MGSLSYPEEGSPVNHSSFKMVKHLSIVALLGLSLATNPAAAQFNCFPSCAANDARFVVIASGTGLVTLSDESLDIQVAAPASATSFQLGFFDGDSGGTDLLLQPHWDLGA